MNPSDILRDNYLKMDASVFPEINTKCVVLKGGSHSTIVGFSSTTQPQHTLPSAYIKKGGEPDDDNTYIFDTFEMLSEGSESLSGEDTVMGDVYTLFDNHGLPYNWEGIEKQWRYIYKEKLNCSPEDHPLLVLSPVITKDKKETEKQVREAYQKLAFEKLNVSAFYLAYEPLAVSFSLGKKSSLVVDIGANSCQITPIIDGIIIKEAVMKSKFAGDFLDYQIMKKLNLGLDAQGSIESWYNSNTWIPEFKKSMLEVSDRKLQEFIRFYEEMTSSTGMTMLSDHSNLKVKKNFLYKCCKTGKRKTITLEGKECYTLAEYLFDPSLVGEEFKDSEGLGTLMIKSIKKASVINTAAMGGHPGSERESATAAGGNNSAATANIVKNNISTLLDNVIITGCTSLIQGMEQRIINEISIGFPQYKITTYANSMLNDRRFQSWMGGANLCNLPTWEFGEWVTKDEYLTSSSKTE